MGWYQIFQDGPEYEQRKQKGSFIPPNISIKDVHAVVPKHLFKRSTSKSLCYILRHLAVTYAFHQLGLKIDSVTVSSMNIPPIWHPVITASFWLLYWGWQGMAFAGIWCLGAYTSSQDFVSHQPPIFQATKCVFLLVRSLFLLTIRQAGHDGLSEYRWFNHIFGMLLHTFVLTPFYAWRTTHRSHHASSIFINTFRNDDSLQKRIESDEQYGKRRDLHAADEKGLQVTRRKGRASDGL